MSLVPCSDMSRKLEELQTGLAGKGADWLRKELESLHFGDLRVLARELGVTRGGLKAELVAAIANEISALTGEVLAAGIAYGNRAEGGVT